MDTIPEEKQIILRKDCEGLDKESALASIAMTLPEDQEVALTEKEAKKLIVYLNRLKHGLKATVPLTCMGEKCPYTHKCPLAAAKPVGKDCLVERVLLDTWHRDYMNELNVDPESRVDVALVGDIVLWEVLEKRAAEELAKKPQIIQRSVAGFQETSDGPKPVYKDEMNQIINFLEKAQKSKKKTLDALIATREAKAKDAQRIISDPSTYAAKLLDKAREMTEENEKAKEMAAKELRAQAAHFGVVEAEVTKVEEDDV